MYKTADEVVQEGASKRFRGDVSAMNSVKVIDMTGPEQRILSGEIASSSLLSSDQCDCFGKGFHHIIHTAFYNKMSYCRSTKYILHHSSLKCFSIDNFLSVEIFLYKETKCNLN